MGIAEVVGDGCGAGHHLLGRVAADQWSRQPLTGARDADGRDHFAVVVAHWRGDAAHVDLALLLVGGIATAADRVQLREQRIDVGDSRGREAWQAGDAVVRRDLLGRVEGQQRLAEVVQWAGRTAPARDFMYATGRSDRTRSR